jgi:hypothetical protein
LSWRRWPCPCVFHVECTAYAGRLWNNTEDCLHCRILMQSSAAILSLTLTMGNWSRKRYWPVTGPLWRLAGVEIQAGNIILSNHRRRLDDGQRRHAPPHQEAPNTVLIHQRKGMPETTPTRAMGDRSRQPSKTVSCFAKRGEKGRAAAHTVNERHSAYACGNHARLHPATATLTLGVSGVPVILQADLVRPRNTSLSSLSLS